MVIQQMNHHLSTKLQFNNMRLPFFKKSDFMPHPQDGCVPLHERISGAPIAGITICRDAVLVDRMFQKNGTFEIEPIGRIDQTIGLDSGKEVVQLAKEAGLINCVVNLAFCDCPMRERLNFKMGDLDLYLALQKNPRSIVREAYEENRVYSVVQSKPRDHSMIFSCEKNTVNLIEQNFSGFALTMNLVLFV